MSEQPKALRLADEFDTGHRMAHTSQWRAEAAAELRRLHAVNADLLEALKLALAAHGVMLMSDPPQEAWKAYGVQQKARAAIAQAEAA